LIGKKGRKEKGKRRKLSPKFVLKEYEVSENRKENPLPFLEHSH
jgi:hypothetical protein